MTPHLQRQRSALLARETQAAQRIDDAYRAAYDQLHSQVASFLLRLHGVLDDAAQAAEDGQALDPDWVLQAAWYRTLLAQIRDVMGDFGTQAEQLTRDLQRVSAIAGAQDAESLLALVIGPNETGAVLGSFNRLSSEALDAFVGSTGNGSPLASLFAGFGDEASKSNALTTLSSAVLLGTPMPALAQQLAQALGAAQRLDLVARNVCELVDPPRDNRREMQPLTKQQALELLAFVAGSRQEAIYAVALHTCMRLGELLGLHWADIHLDDREGPWLQVMQIAQWQRGKSVVMKKPKTARSRRRIALTPSCAQVLHARHARLAAERLRHKRDIIRTCSTQCGYSV